MTQRAVVRTFASAWLAITVQLYGCSGETEGGSPTSLDGESVDAASDTNAGVMATSSDATGGGDGADDPAGAGTGTSNDIGTTDTGGSPNGMNQANAGVNDTTTNSTGNGTADGTAMGGAPNTDAPTNSLGTAGMPGGAAAENSGGGGVANGSGDGGAGGVDESTAGTGGGLVSMDGSSASTGCGQMGQTGRFQAQISVGDRMRGYFMSVPDDYDSGVPNRLFFGYHGSGWNGEMMRGYLDLERPPLLEGSVFVYPDGLARNDEPGGVTEWELSADGRDMEFFDALYEQLRSEYCIDENRVFVNGQSFGGMMTNAVGCARGNVVRAIAVVAGSGPRGSTCQGQVAAWLTHGEDDNSVGFSSGESSRDHWAEANHCDATASVGEPGECQNYNGCDAGYPVIWCPHVDDGGHQHPSFGREAVRQFFSQF